MSEEPAILITDPEKQLITKNNIEIEIYNYDNSHLYYKACDLGTLKEIANLRQENQQLKIQISAREEEHKKFENNWNELKEYIDKNKLILNNPNILNFYIKMQELEKGKSE